MASSSTFTAALAAGTAIAVGSAVGHADPSCWNHAEVDCCQLTATTPLSVSCPNMLRCDGYYDPAVVAGGPVLTTNGWSTIAEYYDHYSSDDSVYCGVWDASCTFSFIEGDYVCAFSQRQVPCSDYGLSDPSQNPILSYSCP